jgi:micrococcal nuclease
MRASEINSAAARRDALFVVLMTAFMLLPAAACRFAWGGTPPADGVTSAARAVTVTGVVDGDTIRVRLDGRDQKVRLIGVNTPEVDWYGGRAECYGSEAALYARHRLLGRSVRLGFDTRRLDPYGRVLAYVYVGRELFNLTLVRNGYAEADAVPPDTRMAPLFSRAERGARNMGAGMWSVCPELRAS